MTWVAAAAAAVTLGTQIFGKGNKEESATSAITSLDINRNERFIGEDRERLEISDEAIDKIIQDVLGGTNGLASIFAGEQNAGVFNSSVASQAAGDLTANIIGEIAKLRAETVKTTDRTLESLEQRRGDEAAITESSGRTGGLLTGIFG